MIGGHEDSYYYQLIANIRRFKGTSQPEKGAAKTITIDGSFNDWKDVTPVFYDTVSDPVQRNCRGWGKDVVYVNETGRNDLVEARVSYDKDNLYFYLKFKDSIKGDFTSQNWISLLLDVDEDAKTGNKGNDFIVASNGETFVLTKTGETTLIKDSAKPIKFKLGDKELELALPRSAINLVKPDLSFRFKWTDGVDALGDWSAFTTDGDAAPNDRYYYRFVGQTN